MAIIAAVVLLISVTAFKQYLPYIGESLSPKQPPSIVLAMEDAYLVGINNQGKAWSLKAKSVDVSQNRAFTTVSEITDGRIFDKDKPAFRLKAAKAVYSNSSRRLKLLGGVRIDGSEGQVIKANGADWDPTSSILRSHGGVNLRTKGSDISTQKLAIDLKNEELTMEKVIVRVDISEVDTNVE